MKIFPNKNRIGKRNIMRTNLHIGKYISTAYRLGKYISSYITDEEIVSRKYILNSRNKKGKQSKKQMDT